MCSFQPINQDQLNDHDTGMENTCNYKSSNGHSNCRMSCKITGESSVHALSQLGQAKTGYSRFFWLLVFVGSVCGCAYEVNSFFSIFFQYPVLIDVKVENRKALEFPAVTVCNLNRIRSSHVRCAVDNLAWFQCSSSRGGYGGGHGGHLQPERRPTILTEFKALFSVSNMTSESEKKYKTRAKNILSNYTKLDDDSKRCYGHRLHDMVKKCSFNSVSCNYKEFAYFYNKQYGNCYTFNKNTRNISKPRTVKKIGPENGLELVLNIELDSYADITSSEGIKVIIHNPQEDPNPTESGINIVSGHESHLSMVKTSFHRLPPPYRDSCRNYPSGGQLSCIRECMQRASMKVCGCVDPFMPDHQKMVLCNLLNETQTACLNRVLDAMSTTADPCDCPLPCFSTEYDLQVTASHLNTFDPESRGSENNPFHDGYFGQTYDPGFCWGTPVTRFKSITKLKVFFKTLDHKIYAQEPMYSDSELFSHLGGNLSLWLGLSFVAMYEFAEKMFMLMKSTVF